MKKIALGIFGAALLLGGVAFAGSGAFCAGYEAGFKAGACHGDAYCIPPISPICPIPNIGEDTYQDGYNRGFLDGLSGGR